MVFAKGMDMAAERILRKAGVVLLLAAVLWTAQGCKSVRDYAQYRVDDMMEMVDLGFTYTEEPSIGLYWNSLDLLVFGFAELDGYFVGLGGNQVGVTRCYVDCRGFIVSEEKIGWGDFDKDDESTLYVRRGGLAGMASLSSGGSPDYTPACVHFVPHIGYLGFVWNARWTQILDFFVGFTTLDLAGDDGTQFGSWPWDQGAVMATSMSAPAAAATTSGADIEPVAGKRPALQASAPSPAGPSATGATGTYTVQRGDTLYSIADQFYNDGSKWKDVWAANYAQIRDVTALRPGMVLRLP